MQPYQEANEEINRQGESPYRIAKNVGSTALAAGTLSGAGALINKVLPFLNKYIPQDMAIKGLSKIDPRFGSFINKAMSNGKSFEEAKEFIQSKASEFEQSQPKQKKLNIIEQHSPALHEFIMEEIKKGRSALEAGALARVNKKYQKDIDKIEKSNNMKWSDILENIFGKPQSIPESPQQQQAQPSQPQQQSGVDPALASIMQQIRQSMNNIRGQ